jgi:hypothetical protein
MARRKLVFNREAKGLTNYKRKGVTREPYLKVLIVCEGSKTEPNYFEEIREYYELNTANVEITGECGSNPMSVVSCARALYKKHKDMQVPFDKVYCVIDRDAHTDYRSAKETVRQLTPHNVYKIIDSVPSFEFWLLLHHEYTTQAFEPLKGNSAGNQVLERLKGHMPNYGKGSKGVFAELIGLLPDAITHAERLEKAAEASGSDNPLTLVHQLVVALQTLKEPKSTASQTS